MRKAIFLVEDINERGPITLLESVYSKLRTYQDNEKEGSRRLGWLSEVQQMLWLHPSDDITFLKAVDFVNDVKSSNKMPEDVDVYYFISCFHNLSNFSINNLLAMDPYVSNFLVEHKIPIIIDCSLEIDENYYTVTRKLFENQTFNADTSANSQASAYFKNMNRLEFYIVGSTYFPDSWDERYGTTDPRKVKVYHGMFPGTFFFHNARDSKFNSFLTKHRDEIVNTIRSRKITEETMVWRALSSEPRFTRSLFQLKVESMGLTDVGEYSRLIPAANNFRFWFNFLFRNEHDLKRVNYVNEESIQTLDEIKILDKDRLDNHNLEYYKNDKFMSWVVLETAFMNELPLLSNTSSMITEKTMQPIISGHPFIPLGGHYVGTILKWYGFKEYPGIEFPPEFQTHLLEELEHITQKLTYLKNLTVKQRTELYESWKEIAVHNFNTYLDINVQRKYLDNLAQMKSKGT